MRDTCTMCTSATPAFVSVKVRSAGAEPPQSLGPKSTVDGQPLITPVVPLPEYVMAPKLGAQTTPVALTVEVA